MVKHNSPVNRDILIKCHSSANSDLSGSYHKTMGSAILSDSAARIPAHQTETALNLPEHTLPRPWE